MSKEEKPVTQLAILQEIARLSVQIGNLTVEVSRAITNSDRVNKRSTEEINEIRRDLDRVVRQVSEDVEANKTQIQSLNGKVMENEVLLAQLVAWQKGHDSFMCPFVSVDNAHAIKLAIERLMVQHFTKNDLLSITYELGLDADELNTDTKSLFSQAIIEEMDNTDRLKDLVSFLQKLRSKVQWPIIV